MTLLYRILPAAKAWCALLGAVAAALLAEFGPDGALGAVLTAVVMASGAVVVYRVPNRRQQQRSVSVRLELEDNFSEPMRRTAAAVDELAARLGGQADKPWPEGDDDPHDVFPED